MNTIDYGFVTAEVTKKNVMKLKIRVAEDGTVKITVPSFTSKQTVTEFVNKNEQWILNAVKKAKSRSGAEFPNFKDDKMPLWGVSYPVVYRNGSPEKAELQGGVIQITYLFGTENPRDAVRFLAEKFYHRELNDRIRERLPVWEEKTGLETSSVTIRKMSSRWGSCTEKTRRIRLSLNLVKLPPQCLDMVIVHELGHILHPNHGAEFYLYMDTFYPDWKKVRRLMEQ